MSLHPLVGHERARTAVAGAHARGTLPAALLIQGPRGVGKQHLAQWIARLLVCAAPTPEGPCEHCGPCRMASKLEHPDIHWYFPLERPSKVSREKLADALEEARLQTLADVRAASVRDTHSEAVLGIQLGTITNLRARAHKRPTMAEGPVFIVGDAELLAPQEASQEAANALLKLLEEPPGDAHFILTSSEPGLLLPTIRSRTVPLLLAPLSHREVADFLVEHRRVERPEADAAASLAHGSIGRALGMLGDGDNHGSLDKRRRDAFGLVKAATSQRPGAGHEVALSFQPSKARGLLDLFGFVEEWIRDLGAVAAGAPETAFNVDATDHLGDLIAKTGIRGVDVPAAFSKIETARELARGNVNPQLVVSGLIRDLRAALIRDTAGNGAAGTTTAAGGGRR